MEHEFDKVSRRLQAAFHLNLDRISFREWVEKHCRFSPNAPFSFVGHEYLKGIYDCEADDISVMKSNQVGGSTWLIFSSLFYADVYGANVFYAYPTYADMETQVQSRINPLIGYSEYLSEKIRNKKKTNGTTLDNVRVKRLGDAMIYFRGSENMNQITTVQADVVLLDEMDRMVPANVPIIEKRMDASDLRIKRSICTPTIPEYGIHAAYLAGTRQNWFIKCPHCNHRQNPKFHKNLIRVSKDDVRFICSKCGRSIDRLMPGEWVAEYPDREKESFSINKLFSSRISMLELMNRYEGALRGALATDTIKDVYNQDMGVPYLPPGSQLTDADLDACAVNSGYFNNEVFQGAFMGVDVQARLMRVSIRKPVSDTKIISVYRTVNYEENIEHDIELLSVFMDQYNIECAVVDEQPERRLVHEFMNRYPGRVYAARFHPHDYKMKGRADVDKKKRIVLINKTDVSDTVRNNYLTRKNMLPQDARSVRDLYDHLKAPSRVLELDEATGVRYGTYTKSAADDYFMGDVYAQVAMEIGKKAIIELNYGQSEDLAVDTTKVILYFNTVDKLTDEMRRTPGDDDIASAMGVTLEELTNIRYMAERATGRDLDYDDDDGDDGGDYMSSIWFPGM